MMAVVGWDGMGWGGEGGMQKAGGSRCVRVPVFLSLFTHPCLPPPPLPIFFCGRTHNNPFSSCSRVVRASMNGV